MATFLTSSAAFLLWLAAGGAEFRATWRCEPERVELGEPFALVLELEHDASTPARELAAGSPELDSSWVVLGAEPARTTRADDGSARTRFAWQVASLEAGERSLAEALSKFVLSQSVTRIHVGAARVEVRGVLEEGEDAPRPLREFPDDFESLPPEEHGSSAVLLASLGATLIVGALAVVLLVRRRRRPAPARVVTPIERLAELERELAGERARESCYELTRLVRGSVDCLRGRERGSLDDEQWLAEVESSFDVPRGIVPQLARVFAHTTRVKYAGEVPTPWALSETFAAARSALESVGPGGRA